MGFVPVDYECVAGAFGSFSSCGYLEMVLDFYLVSLSGSWEI